MRRVVVTGLGMVSPLGYGVQENWKRILRGESGIRAITAFDVSDITARIGGMVPMATSAEDAVDGRLWMDDVISNFLFAVVLIVIAARMLLQLRKSSSTAITE